MGLDSVELILAIEEEFGIEIPYDELSSVATVGDVYEMVKAQVSSVEPVVCLSQKIFYQLRKALSENYGIDCRVITPSSRLADFLSRKELQEGWPFLKLFIDLKAPPSVVAKSLLGFKLTSDSLTVRELVETLITLNGKDLAPQRDTESEIWNRLVRVFVRQLNVRPKDVKPHAQIARDLGVD